MKRIVLLLVACLSLCNVHAAYLRDVPVTLNQPDGTILHCFASGDEFYNYLHDKDGYTIVQHPKTGYYVYAEKREGELVATDYIAGKYDPASKGLQPYAMISPEKWMARRKAWEVPDIRPKNRDIVPNHGTLNNIAIFIRFSDDAEFTNSYSSINNMFNDVSENAVSMRSYFRAASYGAIDIPTSFYPGHSEDVIISYQDTHPRSYFQPYNATTNTNGYSDYEDRKDRESQLLADAVTYVNNNYPIPSELNIDYDNDGFVDNVCFIVRGTTSGWSELLWPHKSSLSRNIVKINGKRVFVYNFQLADATNHFKTSTMCHEMNHSLGAPDLYHYYENTDINPVGRWDLMEENATPPQHCGAYMKIKYGHWIDDIPEISQAGTYTLNPISSATPTNIAYKIPTEDPKQFYILEYRDKTSLFETSLPGSGLLIYRIDTRFNGNADYDPDNGIYDEIYIFRPNGTTTVNGSLSTAHFSSNVSRTEFSFSTNPRPFLTNGSFDNNLKITDITNSGSTISFTIGNNSTCEPPTSFIATTNRRNVQLSWDAAANAQSYSIFRNNALIGSTTETSYLDEGLPYGSYNYFVKSEDTNGISSTSTEDITVSIEPVVTDLDITLSNVNPSLSWSSPEWITPEHPTATLTYGGGKPFWYWPPLYYAHRYLAEDLAQFAGKVLYKTSTYVEFPGTYTVYVYTSTTENQPDPNSLAMSKEYTITASKEWIDFIADTPITLTGNDDLWVVIKQENTGDEYPIPSTELSEHNINAFYASLTSPTSLEDAQLSFNSAWMITASLTDGSFTYNLYQDGVKIANKLTNTTYNATLNDNAANQFVVKTNYYGGESAASNMIGFAKGTASIGSLSLAANDKMTLLKNSTLTVGTLSNTISDNLVLEDGAKLINNDTGVKATVKKTIEGFQTNNNKGNWYLIASPITEQLNIADETNLKAADASDYDLYVFDQSSASEWLNYKQDHFITIDNKTGYLYAHRSGIDIAFAGTLNNTEGSVPISYTSGKPFAEYNLVGNPFPCDATIDKTDFYRIVETQEGSKIQLATTSTIAPMEGIFVKAVDGNDKTVTFSKATAKGNVSSGSMITMSVSRNPETVLDIARIRFDGNLNMEKLMLHDGGTRLFIPQSGLEYALVVNDDFADIAVNFTAATDGTYTIDFEIEGIVLDCLHLIDNIAGVDIDLLDTPSYSFVAKTDDYPSRFRLLFNAIDEHSTFFDDIKGDILIMDVTGRVISTDRNAKLTPGVYILRTVNSNEIKTEKIIIK